MKTTMDLPDELVREVKLRAVVQGRAVKDLVADLLREGLGMDPPGRRKKRSPTSKVVVGPTGLPVVRCDPAAPATRMRVRELLSLEQESTRAEDSKRAGIPL
ncbi:MAG: antitoxin [Vicinamibacteria bacterium]|nr:antitoxin [Vicinamibacteria bacterium]